MFSETIQPTISGQASFLYAVSQSEPESRASLQILPMNLSADEIRAMVRDILG